MKVYSLNAGSVRVVGSPAGFISRYALVNRQELEVTVCEGEGELEQAINKRSPSISLANMSSLLQSSYIIPPFTIYDNVYVANIGDVLELSYVDGEISLAYNHEFPFRHKLRKNKKIDRSIFLEDLYHAASRQIKDGNVFLFHTAGKDSNTILASYLEAGKADDLILLSGESKGDTDESHISRSIAKKFGLRHVVAPIQETLDEDKLHHLKKQLSLQPLPNVDAVMLPLCLYDYSSVSFSAANCIFGDGNDGYFLSLPSVLETRLSGVTSLLSYFRRFTLPISSDSRLINAFRSRMEWSGVYGLTYFDLLQVLKGAVNVYSAVAEDERGRFGLNPIERKSDAYATRAISQRMIQKLSLFCLSNNSNCVLPFTDEQFVNEWGYLGLSQVADCNKGLNKAFLREIVRDIVGLDTTAIGKKGWSFDYVGFVKNHAEIIINEVELSGCWTKEVVGWVKKMMSVRESVFSSSVQACRSVYVLFMVSLWVSSRSSSPIDGRLR